MDFKKFLSQDLSVIKKKLNADTIKQKDESGNNILNYLVSQDSLPVIKYVFKFCILNCRSLFLEKNNRGVTILDYLFSYDGYGRIVYYSVSKVLSKIKYVLKFYTLNFPFFILKIHYNGRTVKGLLICNDFLPRLICLMKFYSFNFPEMSNRTNNFILPLMMEIQN